MIFKNAEALPVEMLPGLIRRTLVSGDAMMICRVVGQYVQDQIAAIRGAALGDVGPVQVDDISASSENHHYCQ
jgi:hypothetical protein